MTVVLSLNKQDLIHLVKGTNPSYTAMENSLVKKCGTYIGGFKDLWTWDQYKLEKLSEEQLLAVYVLCK
mgnify:FL=1|nr:MAG TPA_asm: hypothetical protein [Caudoviricetes sp.]